MRHPRLATADAVLYATALAHGADLLTCDRHFEKLPSVRFIPKSCTWTCHHCEFHTPGGGRPALHKTSPYRHGRACPGHP
jgi:hypothetical protein